MSLTSVIHSPDEVLHIDQVRLSKALSLPLDQADLVLQFGEELDGLFIAAADLLHDFLDGTDNEDPVLLILPAIFQGNRYTVQQEAIQDLGFCRHRPVCLVLKEDLRDPDKGELFTFRAVKIVIHAYHHLLPRSSLS